MTVLKGKRGSLVTCVSFGEVAKRRGQRATLEGFYFGKAVPKKFNKMLLWKEKTKS